MKGHSEIDRLKYKKLTSKYKGIKLGKWHMIN